MFCISLNYKKADIEIREKLSLSKDILSDIKKGVYLETCNRVELYGTDGLYEYIEKYFGGVKEYLLVFENEKAISHLFKVACGLDSMVMGEDEILGQVKDAFKYSLDNGFTDYELNTVFKAAVTCAKRVKTDTLLSKKSTSVATLAASLCSKYKGEKKRVLVIGASGDTGHKVIKNLISTGDFEIFATVREHSVKNGVRLIDYKDRYKYLKDADIVISATKSPHFTITKDRAGDKKKLYIDLAVPRDIDTAIEGVITIDDLKELARRNNEIRQGELEAAWAIIEEDTEALFKELALHKIMPLKMSEELKHFVYSFRDNASPQEFTAFCDVVERMEEEK